MSKAPLKIVPLNPIAGSSRLVRVGSELRAVVIVKATFALAPDRSAWPIEAEPLVACDIYAGDVATTRLVAANDFAPYLPGAGVVFHATAHAARGRPITQMPVRAAIFQGDAFALTKHLFVHGDRKKGGPTTPFVEMPIVYERAYGGPSVAANPIGIGASTDDEPNIVDPRAPEKPVGLGPIAPSSALRAESMRVFDEATRDGDVVNLPADAPFEALHAAPADQRILHFRGDEWIVLDGVHPTLRRFQTQLPFARGRAQALRRREELIEIELFGDTLIVDADRLVASVVWRGHIVVDSIEEAAALTIFTGLELPSLPIVWPSAPTRAWPTSIPDTTTEEGIQAIREAIAVKWDQKKVDLDQRVELVGKQGPRAKSVVPIRIRAEAAAKEGRSLSGLRLRGADLDGALLPDADLAGLDLAGASFRLAELVGAKFDHANLEDAVLAGANLERASLVDVRAKSARFLGAALRGADLEGADLTGADFRGADLRDANLSGALVLSARFEDADLRGAKGLKPEG